jgi:hypothetical protein
MGFRELTRITQGKRASPNSDGLLFLADGEYGLDTHGKWYARPPGNHMGNLSGHSVTEHDDGTITVSPSILIDDGRSVWHGYLERGAWRQI